MPVTTKLDRKIQQIVKDTNVSVEVATQRAEAALELESSIDIGAFTSKAERRVAEGQLSKYLNEYDITTIADKNALQQLIYFEVLQLRLQQKLDDMYARDVKAIPYDIVGTMHKNSEAILKIKDTLGLNRARKEKLGTYDAIEHLKRRFIVWRSQNQASRTLKCPYCQEFILLKMRTDAWESQKHPWFQDNMIYNQHLFANYGRSVKIDDAFIAGCLGTSADYVQWVMAKARQSTASNPVQETVS